MGMTITETQRTILRGLDNEPTAYAELEKMGKEDIRGVFAELDKLYDAGLIDYDDGTPFPSAAGTVVAWS